MAHFAYTGIDARGKTVRGTLDADDVKGVRQALKRQGVFLDTATPLANAPAAKGAAKAPGAAKGRTLEESAPQLAALLKRVKRLAANHGAAVSLSTRQLATLV